MSSQTFETYVVAGYAEEGFVTNVNTLDVDLQAGQSTTTATVFITKPVQELRAGSSTVTGVAENSITSLNTDVASGQASTVGVAAVSRVPINTTLATAVAEVVGVSERIIHAGTEKIDFIFVDDTDISGTMGPGKINDVITADGKYIAIQGGQNQEPQVLFSTSGVTWTGSRPTGLTTAQCGIARRFAKVATDTFVIVGGGAKSAVDNEKFTGGRIWYTDDNFNTLEYVDLDTILQDVGLGNGDVPATPIRLTDVTVGGGKIIVTGNYGIILTASTTDLDSWTLQDPPSFSPEMNINAGTEMFVAYSGTRYVVTTSRFGTAYSTNGSSWTVGEQAKGSNAPHPASSGVVKGIEYGGGEFVLFGSAGDIYTTSNGESVTKQADAEEIGPVGLNSAKYNSDTDIWAIGGSGGTIVVGTRSAEDWTFQTTGDNEVNGRPLRGISGIAYKNSRWVVVGDTALIGYANSGTALIQGVELNAFASTIDTTVTIERAEITAAIQATGVDVDATVSRVVDGGDINHEAESSTVTGVAERIIYQVGSATLKPTDNNLISAVGVERIITSGDIALRPTVEHEVSGVAERQVNINGNNQVEITTGSSTITAVAERELRDNDVDLIVGSSSVSSTGVKRTVNGIDATPHAQNSTVDVTARLSFLIRIALKPSDAVIVAQASRSYPAVDIALTTGSSSTTATVGIGRFAVEATPKAQDADVIGLSERGINDLDATVAASNSSIKTGFAERVVTANGSIVPTPANIEAEGIAERGVNIIDGTVAAGSSQVTGLAENAITGAGNLVSADASIAVGRAERESVLLSGVGPQGTSSVTGVAERSSTNINTQALTQGDASISGSGNLGYPGSGDLIVTDVAKVSGLGVRGSNSLDGMTQVGDADVIGAGKRGSNELDASLTQGLSGVTGLGERTVNSVDGINMPDFDALVTGVAERGVNASGVLTTTSSLVTGVAENTVVSEGDVNLDQGAADVDGLAERTVVRLPDVWAYYVGPKEYVDPASSSKTFSYKTPSPSAPIAAPKFIIAGQTGATSKYNGTYEVWVGGGVVIDTPMQVTGTGLNGLNATQSQVKVHAVNAPYGTSGPVGIVNLYLRETATKYQWLVLTLDRDQTEATGDDRYVWHAIETAKSIDFRVSVDTVFSGVWTSDRLAISARESSVIDNVAIAPRSLTEFNTLQPAASSVVGVTKITSNSLEATLDQGASSVTAVVEIGHNALSAELVSQQSSTLGFAFGIEIIETDLVQGTSSVTGVAERGINDIDATPVVTDHSDVVAVVEITSNALAPRRLFSTDVFVQGVAERTVEGNEATHPLVASASEVAGIAEREIDDNLATHAFKPTENNLIVGAAEREIRSGVTLETGTSSVSGVAERTINSASSPSAGVSSVTGIAERTVEDNLITNALESGVSSVGGVAERHIVDVSAALTTGLSSVADGGTKIERRPIVAALENHDSRTATDPKGVVTRHIDAAVQSGDSRSPGRIIIGTNLREGVKRVDDASVSGVAEREVVLQSGIGIPSIVPAENTYLANVTADSLDVVAGSSILRGTYTRVILGDGNWVIENSVFRRSDEHEGYVAYSKVNFYASNRRDFIIFNKDTNKWVNVYYQYTTTIPAGGGVATQYNIGFPSSNATNRTTTPSLVDGVSTRTVNGITADVQAQSATTPNSFAERQVEESPDGQDFNMPASPSLVSGSAEREITVDAGVTQVDDSQVVAVVEYKRTTRVELRSGPSRTPNSFAFGIEDLYETLESGPSHVVGSGVRISKTHTNDTDLVSQQSVVSGVSEREIVNVPDYTFFYNGTIAGLGPKTTGTVFGASYSGVDLVITSPTAYAGTYEPITNDDGFIIVMTSPGVFETRSAPSYNRYVKYVAATGKYFTLVLWDRTSESQGARWILAELSSDPAAWTANSTVNIPSFVTYSSVANPGTPLQISTNASRPVAYTLNTSKVEQGESVVVGAAERVIENNSIRQDLVQGDAAVTGLGERSINTLDGIDMPDFDALVTGVAERKIDDNLAVHDLRPTEFNVVAGHAERVIEQNEATANLRPTENNLVTGVAERIIENNEIDQAFKPTDNNLVVGVAERKMVSEPIALQPSENNIVSGLAERIIDDENQEDIALDTTPSIIAGVAERTIEDNQINQNVDAQPSEVTGVAERSINGLIEFVDASPSRVSGLAERTVRSLTRQDLTVSDVVVAGDAERVIDTNGNNQDLVDEESDVIGIAERIINTLEGTLENSSVSIVAGVAEREIRPDIALVNVDSIVTGVGIRNIDLVDDSIITDESTVSGLAEREIPGTGIGGELLTPAADPNIVYVEDDITLNYPSYAGNGYYTLVSDRRIKVDEDGYYVDSGNKRAYIKENANGTFDSIIWHDFFGEWINFQGSTEDIRTVAIDGTVARTAAFAGVLTQYSDTISRTTTDSIIVGVAERAVEDEGINHELIASDVIVAGVAERIIRGIPNANINTQTTISGLGPKVRFSAQYSGNNFLYSGNTYAPQSFTQGVYLEYQSNTGWAVRTTSNPNTGIYTATQQVGGFYQSFVLVDISSFSSNGWAWLIVDTVSDPSTWLNQGVPSPAVSSFTYWETGSSVTSISTSATRTAGTSFDTILLAVTDSEVVGGGARELDDVEEGGTALDVTESLVVGNGIRTANLLENPRSGPSVVTGLGERTVEDNELVQDVVSDASTVSGISERQINRVADGEGPLALSPSSNDSNVSYNSDDKLVISGFTGHLNSYNGTYEQFRGNGYVIESGSDYVVYPELFVAGAGTPHNAYLKQAGPNEYFIVVWNETQQDWYVSFSTGDPFAITALSVLPLGTALQSQLAINSELKKSPFKTQQGGPSTVAGVSERGVNLLVSPASQESTVTGIAERTIDVNEVIPQEVQSGQSSTTNTAKIIRKTILDSVKAQDATVIGVAEDIVVGQGPQSVESGRSTVVGAGFRTSVEEDATTQSQESTIAGVGKRSSVNLREELESGDASVSGVAERKVTGTGTLVARQTVFGSVNGEGDREVDDNGRTHPLVSDDAEVGGIAERKITATGNLQAQSSTIRVQIYQTLGFQEAIPVEQRFKIAKKPVRVILIRRPASGDS